MKELAEPHIDKPFSYMETVIDFALTLLSDSKNWKQDFTPLDILEAGLAIEGSTHVYDGESTVTIKKFFILPEQVKSLRTKITAALLELLAHSDIRRGYKAAKLFERALCYPVATREDCSWDKNRNQWDEEFEKLLDSIYKRATAGNLYSIVIAALGRSVRYHAMHGRGRIKTVASNIVALSQASLHNRVAAALLHLWGLSWQFDGKYDYEQEKENNEKSRVALVDELMEKYPNAQDLLNYIGNYLNDLLLTRTSSSKLIGVALLDKI